MADSIPTAVIEELGYFYDSIHGRIALEELPRLFHPALKSAFSSKALARLKRIGQLGHTSVSFFSATHTRFSHAVGSMLVMNKLFNQVRDTGLLPEVFQEATKYYPDAATAFGDEKTMVHCHLLLTALYQDVGELPFQKVTGQYFSSVENDIGSLVTDFPKASPGRWNVKELFSVLCLIKDMSDPLLKEGFAKFDRDFLVYLLTGEGAPDGAKALPALLQMVDGVIDADRLDYVYRDASVTIGSLSRPRTVLESIVGYEPGKVVVNDPRPVTDFLSTRMRLWTFVYSAADVRLMHTLLKTVLDGRWDRPEATQAFKKAKLAPELTFAEFMTLDDGSLMERIDRLDTTNLESFRQKARTLIQVGTFDYECRVLRRRSPANGFADTARLPSDWFFDLMSDEGNHQLYHPQSVFVRQGLTSRIAELVPLENSAGAFSPLFDETNSAMLVRDGFYLFLPRSRTKGAAPKIEKTLDSDLLFQQVIWEDAWRSLACPSDTRTKTGFLPNKAVSISYCSRDWPTVVRIVRELYRRKRRYRLFIRPFDGTGETASGNSANLVNEAAAVLVVASTNYLERALDARSYVNIEVAETHARSKFVPIAVLGVDERADLEAVPKWDWGSLNERWRGEHAVVPAGQPLKHASEEVLRTAVGEALKSIDSWKKKA